MHYVLDKDGNPVKEPDLLTWARWLETGERKLAYDEIKVPGHPNTRVSTVFLGIDYAFGGGKPILWETMVFAQDGWAEEECRRYGTRAAALAGHAIMVAEVMELIKVGKWPPKQEED